MAPLLFLDAAAGALIASLATIVGVLNRRRVAEEAQGMRALRSFAVAWFGYAGFAAANASRSLLAGLGWTDVSTHVAIQIAAYGLFCLTLWGLTTYLLVIYRGTLDRTAHVRAYFAGLFVLLVAVTLWNAPSGIETDGWVPSLIQTRTLPPPLFLLVLLSLLGPPLVLAVAYAALYPRTADPVARRRILLVSASLVLWVGVNLLANATAIRSLDWWPPASRALAVLATLGLVQAYRERPR